MRHHATDDRRTRRTKSLLHGALASLLHEKPWDDIVVKEIISRADIGRSTFYTHVRDKDALLRSGLRELVHAADPGPCAHDRWHRQALRAGRGSPRARPNIVR
jgi:AcrR family transcriptional regulator